MFRLKSFLRLISSMQSHIPVRVLKQRLPALIRQSHKDNRGTYGTPRITDDLKKLGETAGRHKVASIMRKNGIVGLPPKNFRKTTDSGHQMPV